MYCGGGKGAAGRVRSSTEALDSRAVQRHRLTPRRAPLPAGATSATSEPAHRAHSTTRPYTIETTYLTIIAINDIVCFLYLNKYHNTDLLPDKTVS